MLGVTTATVTMIGITTAAVVECHQGKYEAKLGTEPDLVFQSGGQQIFFCKGSGST